jgi:hypothetical protein
MVQDTGRRCHGLAFVVRWRAAGAAAVWAVLPLVGGCVTNANLSSGEATLAFESIDGPPRPVFDRLVARLDAEAQSHKVAVVPRGSAARYRVRAYLAATVTRGKTAVNWVWDVYDAGGHRMTRLSGEEQAGRTAKDAWSDADDRVVGRIAESGMRQLAAFTRGTTATPGAAAPAAAPAPAPSQTAEGVATSDLRVLASAESTVPPAEASH